MNRRRPFRLALFAVCCATPGLLAAGCSDDEVSTDDCLVVGQVDGVTEVRVTASNMAFDVSCLEVQPGTLEVTVVNEDASVPHNMRINGEGIDEATELRTGPDEQLLTVELTEPGEYPFKCDPHSNMKGVVVVAAASAADAETDAETGQ